MKGAKVYLDSWADAYELSRELARQGYKSRQHRDTVTAQASVKAIRAAIRKLGLVGARLNFKVHPDEKRPWFKRRYG